MNKLKILFPLLYIITEWDLWTKNVIRKKRKKKKKKAHVNVKVSHLFQLSSKKWIKLVQKIPRDSDASLIHVNFVVISENKKHHHWKPFLTFIVFDGLLSQCWLQKHSASTMISLKAECTFEGWRSGEIGKENGSWSQIKLVSNPSSHHLS